MINDKAFSKTKITKPAGELTPNDIGSLVKVITVDGVEVVDILVTFQAGASDFGPPREALSPNDVRDGARFNYSSRINPTSSHYEWVDREEMEGPLMLVRFHHVYRRGVLVNLGMRTVVRRPIEGVS